MIGAARIKGFDLPEAVAAPNGMPAVASEAHEAANGQLLWRALRETIRHSVQPVRGEERDGVLGWLWRGNPQQIAEAMWDGLDRSQLADETLAALYAYLHRVRQLTRTDTGNKGREWWVADTWNPSADPVGARATAHQAALDRHAAEELRRVNEPAALHEDDSSVYPGSWAAAELDSGPLPPPAAPDYAAMLEGFLTQYRDMEARLKRALAKASLAGGTLEELTDEVISLRGVNEELRAANKRLREENTAYRVIMEQDDD